MVRSFFADLDHATPCGAMRMSAAVYYYIVLLTDDFFFSRTLR